MKISSHRIAGCDEVGRGSLAGPVVAASVILPENILLIKEIKDSKLLTPHKREQLKHRIEQEAVAWAIGEASVAEIDQYNILQATFLAMHRSINQLLQQAPITHLLVDGNRFKPYPNLTHTCIVKGDRDIPAIAAASIMAKTYRDDIMKILHSQYPQYHWNKNKGYPTQQHRDAIAYEGITPLHRKSYKTCQIPSKG